MDVVPFDRVGFQTGILTAMGVGLPADPDLRPQFVFAGTTSATTPVDDEGIPYDVTSQPVLTAGRVETDVLCAIEYLDAVGQVVDLGIIAPTQIRITLLDAQYQRIKGFDHVLIDGDRYNYRRTQPPIGMVTETVWIVHCRAEDDT
jgi:hypothetical protein